MDEIIRMSWATTSENNVPSTIGADDTSDAYVESKYVVFRPAVGEWKNIWNIVGKYAWSPIVYNENYRRRANFKLSQIIALDFDDGAMTLKDAEEWIKDHDFRAVVGTTKSHQKLKHNRMVDRFRIIIKSDKPCLDSAQYEYTLKQFIKETKADVSCKDAARYFYPCKTKVFENHGTIEPSWMEVPHEETAEFRQVIAERINKFEYRQVEKIPSKIWGHILWGCKPPGRHKLCYIIGAHLGLRGFETDEIMKLLIDNKSPLLEIGVDDARRAIWNGSERSLTESGLRKGRGRPANYRPLTEEASQPRE